MKNKALISGHTDLKLSEVLDKLRLVAETPFEKAIPIPAAVNHSKEFFNHELKSIFMKEWICIGRSDEILEAGDFLTQEIAGISVLVVRQNDGSIRAFINACAHRFARLLQVEQGNTKRFTCPYHAWTYNIKGDLVRAPYMEMKNGFDKTKNGLRRLYLELWEGFVYVNLSEKQPKNITACLNSLHGNVVGKYNMSSYKTVMRKEMVWDANWKNLIENFTESYHVPIAHKKTFALHKKPLEDYYCGEDDDHYCYHQAVQEADTGGGAAHPRNNRLKGDWRRTMVDFCVFPCQLITLMPDFLWYITVLPQGVGQFKATWGVAIPPEILHDIKPSEYEKWLSDLSDYMDVANDEDKILVQALNQGSASTILPTGSLHPIEKNLWQFTQYLSKMCQI
jgi:phenylpropionate dioxygenase-like ring-hydroxylating dioxygenase large terminal subunit